MWSSNFKHKILVIKVNDRHIIKSNEIFWILKFQTQRIMMPHGGVLHLLTFFIALDFLHANNFHLEIEDEKASSPGHTAVHTRHHHYRTIHERRGLSKGRGLPNKNRREKKLRSLFGRKQKEKPDNTDNTDNTEAFPRIASDKCWDRYFGTLSGSNTLICWHLAAVFIQWQSHNHNLRLVEMCKKKKSCKIDIKKTLPYHAECQRVGFYMFIYVFICLLFTYS